MKKGSDLSRSIWITWERQTRNRSASGYVGVPLQEITYDNCSAFSRYVKSGFATINLIMSRKPRYVFAQNPSVVLGVLVVICSKIFRFTLIVDAHNSGIHYEGRFKKLINLFNKIIIRNSKFIIVTNEDVARVVCSKGGTPLILPDPLPCLPLPTLPRTNLMAMAEKDKRLKALCITSWGEDEPIEALIAAAKNFGDSVDFYFTGNYRKADFSVSDDSLPGNVNLLGFVDENDYFSLLANCDFTVDLTTRSDCLVCGAYESVSAGKPVLLSDTKPQRAYFGKGAVFCTTNPAGIHAGIDEMLRNLEWHKAAIVRLKAEILQREELRRDNLISSIIAING